MKQISGNCVLAFGLWGDQAPEHVITSVEIIDDIYMVSGDKAGQLIVWKLDENQGKMYPIWYLLGHCGSISSITRSMITGSDARYIVTLSNQKEMGLWSCVDGRCVRLERHMTFEHTVVKAYGPSNSKNVFLVCCGHYQGIHVLDAVTFTLLLSLQSCAHPDWVRSVCMFEHKHTGMHIVLGLSISGAITMWTIDSLEVFSDTKVLFETESKMLLLHCPISISICPHKPRLVMVLSSTSVQIYDAASWSLLTEYNSKDECFISGWFLDYETILLRPKKGHCRLYKVPNNLDNISNQTGELTAICSLDCDSMDVMCESVMTKDHCITILCGCGKGRLFWWKMNTETLSPGMVEKAAIRGYLQDQWLDLDMTSLIRPFQNQYSITCCHCEPSINSLIMGTNTGSILVMELLHSLCVAIFSQNTSKLPFTILSGHTKAVFALQYAKNSGDDMEGTVTHWLWSGSEDFSVRLWNLTTRICVSVFHCHTGPITSFVAGPPLGLTKGKHDGKIMAPKKAAEAEQEVMKPINLNSWFGQRLYVSFDDDNGVSFLSLETKKVVLHVSLFSPVEMIAWRRDQISVVLACADGSFTVWDLGSGQLERREMGQIGEDILDSSTDHFRFTCPPPLIPRLSHMKERLKHSCPMPMLLHPVHMGQKCISQVLICDTESLLVEINCQSTSKGLLQAQLLLSLINTWTKDPCMDQTLENTIGLVRPPRHTCFGHVNVKNKTLSFHLQMADNPIGESMAMLAGVSLCHAINNLPDSLLQSSWPRLSSSIEDKDVTSFRAVDNRTEVRQVCCLLATSLATTNLPHMLSHSLTSFKINEIPLIIQTFLQKYQNRCLEIREAAKTLLHAALDFLSSDQRHDLVQYWGYNGRVLARPDTLDLKQDQFKSIDTIKVSRSLLSIWDAPNICDWRFWTHIAEVPKPPEIDVLQTVTLTFLGIVGCRYGSPDLELTPTSNIVNSSFLKSQPIDRAIYGFGLDDHRLARMTCDFLMSLLVTPPPNSSSEHKMGSHWSSMRCLAITLLGQGFPVWEPYVDISILFSKLLEIVAPAEKVLSGWTQGQLLTDEMDAVRSARSSLHVIALARPKVFATVLSIEVLRLQTQSTSNSGSVVAPQSNGTLQGKVGTTLNSQSQPPLLAARHEVIEVMKVLCERKTREIHEVFPEIMDILLACLSKLELRQYDLQQLFPPILLFRIASSHTASGKVCVGTRSGQVSFYDVKVGKFNTSPGHNGPVTSVSFSPDGKQMASYSMPDNSVCIWQLSSSGLFGMGSSHQVKLASKLNVPPIKVSHTVADEDHSLLLWLEWTESKTIHLVTNAGLINKIKL